MAHDWHRALRWYRSKVLTRLGYREDLWGRVVQIDSWRDYLRTQPVSRMDALEISPAGVSYWREFGFKSYTAVGYPEFDITKQPDGLKVFLEANGFEADVRAWGNSAAVKANLCRWKEYGWRRNLANDPLYPVTVWAFARAKAPVPAGPA